MATRAPLLEENGSIVSGEERTLPTEFYMSSEESDDYYGIAPQIYSLATFDGQTNSDFWSLRAGQSGSSNFEIAWQFATGKGIEIGIVDEGVNYTHLDLSDNYDTSIDFDPRDEISSWDAQPDDMISLHGTNVAGVIAGSIHNDIGTVGAAPDSTITASYLRYGNSVTMSELAETLAHQSVYDIANNSWGFTNAFADNFLQTKFAGIVEAIDDVVTTGREGLGTVLVFAAGNGKAVFGDENIGDDANFHNLTNSRQTIAVGAHDAAGNAAFFSSPGTSVLLSAPGVGLLTTDGNEIGSLASNYVSGTSFAAPLVSSAIALMLEANPNLGYRDVQQILAITANPSQSASAASNGAGKYNGGGLVFDREVGFGNLDAAAAVSLARNWSAQSTAANEQELSLSLGPAATPDTSMAVIEATLSPSSDDEFAIQWVELQLNLSDKDLKGLRIELVSPDGTRAVIAENLYAAGSRTVLNFTFSSAMSLGESPYGTWRLELSHDTPSRQFSVNSAELRFFGDYAGSDDTQYFTSAFAGLAADDASRREIADTDGGIDTLNFAASNAAVIADLSGESRSMLDGAFFNLDGSYENAIGSIRADRLNGSSASNLLSGDFGDDMLSGQAGQDTLIGGAGNDRLDGGLDGDRLEGGAGDDTYVDPDGDTIIELAGNGVDRILSSSGISIAAIDNVEDIELTGNANTAATGNALANRVTGNAGANRLDGGAGADTLAGGLGNDTYVDPDGDIIVELAGEGTDAIEASTSFSLASYDSVENLVLTGNANTTARGNGLANLITGNAGANRIDGAGGLDTLAGGLGDDTYVNQSGAIVREFSGHGNDTIESSSTFSLSGIQHVENLTLIGSARANATGNSYANVLTGNLEDNRLRGGDGLDTLIGGLGNDTYVDPAGDVIREFFSQGTDTVEASGNFSLSGVQHVENLLLTGTANSAGIGNSYDNVITGNAGNNRLRGGAGADTLNGAEGNDVFVFGSLSDSTGAGHDTILRMNMNQDRFDFEGHTAGIAAKVSAGALSLSSFDTDLAQAIGAGQLGANQAVLFDPNSGDLNVAGHQFLVVDANGIAGYQAGQDYVVELIGATGTLTLEDFT